MSASEKKNEVSLNTSHLSSTSAKIRFLSSLNLTTAQIEKELKKQNVFTKNGDPIRYQHVRNVLMTRLTTK